VEAVRLQFELPSHPALRLNRAYGQLYKGAGQQWRAVADIEIISQFGVRLFDDLDPASCKKRTSGGTVFRRPAAETYQQNKQN
jgi:hypothetical protein